MNQTVKVERLADMIVEAQKNKPTLRREEIEPELCRSQSALCRASALVEALCPSADLQAATTDWVSLLEIMGQQIRQASNALSRLEAKVNRHWR